MAVTVVISELRVSELIPGKKHGRSPAAHQNGTGIADHAVTEFQNLRILRLTFRAAVPAPVVVGSIGIVPAIAFVVLFIIGIEVIQREAVMTGQEIHAGIVTGIVSVCLRIEAAVHVTGAAHAPGSVPRFPAAAFQKFAHGIPVPSVPFRPASVGRKTADLIHASGIPCFRDQLYIAQNRVIGQQLQKRRIVQRRTVRIPSEDACQIEAEPIHPIVHRPVAQTLQNHLAHNGMVAVQCVSAAAEIEVGSVRHQHVVNLIVKSLEAEHRSLLVSLSRMVEHHVKNYFNSILMKRLDQLFQLRSLMVMLLCGRIIRVRRKEANRIVAPVIAKLLSVMFSDIHLFIKLKDRHQLHRIDSQFL